MSVRKLLKYTLGNAFSSILRLKFITLHPHLVTNTVNNLKSYNPLAQSDFMRNNIVTVHSLRKLTKLKSEMTRLCCVKRILLSLCVFKGRCSSMTLLTIIKVPLKRNFRI